MAIEEFNRIQQLAITHTKRKAERHLVVAIKNSITISNTVEIPTQALLLSGNKAQSMSG